MGSARTTICSPSFPTWGRLTTARGNLALGRLLVRFPYHVARLLQIDAASCMVQTHIADTSKQRKGIHKEECRTDHTRSTTPDSQLTQEKKGFNSTWTQVTTLKFVRPWRRCQAHRWQQQTI